MFVSKRDVTIDEKRRILADSRRRFETAKASHPALGDSQVKLLMIKERLKELKSVGKVARQMGRASLPEHGGAGKGHLLSHGRTEV